MLTPLTAEQTEPMTATFQIAAGIFTIVAIAYFVQLWRLIARLKAVPALWQQLGQPSLTTFSGQRAFDRILYQPCRSGIDDPAVLREISRTKWLQLAGILSFAGAVTTFFVGRQGLGA